METNKLKGLLSSQIETALAQAREHFNELISDVNTIAGSLGAAYRFGEVRAPGLNAEKSLERLPNGKPKVEAIGHYQGHAHSVLTQVALNAARRLHRQNRPPEDYAALQVAIDLLRFVINARADMARLEAAASEGPFAFRKPQVDMFHQVEERLRKQAQAIFTRLEGLPSPADIVQISSGQVRNGLAAPQVRVRTALNRAEEKAREQGNGKRLKQVQDCRKALNEAEKAAKQADPLDTVEVGAAVQAYYGVVNRFPWYFGLSPRPRNENAKGSNKPKQVPANKEAKAS